MFAFCAEKLKNREQSKLPDSSDVDGAAHGLVRLYSLYQFNVSAFADEGRISTTLDNGQIVLSEPSVLPVNCECFYTLFQFAMLN